jgi:hypothetical protein
VRVCAERPAMCKMWLAVWALNSFAKDASIDGEYLWQIIEEPCAAKLHHTK